MAKPGRIQIVKYAPPPPELPAFGQADPSQVSFIGRTNYVAALEEKKFVFGIKRVDRRRHLYLIGKSGVGKSKAIELLARQDIAYGQGLCLIDPHGDLIESLLDFIPEERIDDVVIIDPTDMRHAACFNPFRGNPPEFRHELAQGLLDVMQRQFGSSWTPKIEHLLRFTFLALLDYPDATFYGAMSMLTDGAYRTAVLSHVNDDMVRRFWSAEFPAWAERFDADTIIPLVNKLGQFFSNPVLRGIFSQKENKVDIPDVIRTRRIVLVNLSRGGLGETNAAFLGGIVMAKMKQAGMMRAALRQEERHDFYVYIDEFHALASETLGGILADARKYGFCLTIAHQYLGQLPAKLQMAILGNVGSLVVFRVGGDDAAHLKSEMAPVFDVKDMINLGVQEFYAKMVIDGENYDPFSAETLKVLPAPHPSFRDRIIEASGRKYGPSGGD